MQKLLIMERDSKEELQEAIKKNIEDAKFKITSLSVLEGDDQDGSLIDAKPWEAWMVIDMPENPDTDLLRTGQLNVGFEST